MSFAYKLRNCCDTLDDKSVGEWSAAGTEFHVHGKDAFLAHFNKQLARNIKMETFRRQLNMYRFATNGIRSSILEGTTFTIRHPCFVRGEPEKMKFIVRATNHRAHRKLATALRSEPAAKRAKVGSAAAAPTSSATPRTTPMMSLISVPALPLTWPLSFNGLSMMPPRSGDYFRALPPSSPQVDSALVRLLPPMPPLPPLPPPPPPPPPKPKQRSASPSQPLAPTDLQRLVATVKRAAISVFV